MEQSGFDLDVEFMQLFRLIGDGKNDEFRRNIKLPEDLSKFDPIMKYTLLHEAGLTGNEEIFLWLLDQEGIDLSLTTPDGHTIEDFVRSVPNGQRMLSALRERADAEPPTLSP